MAINKNEFSSYIKSFQFRELFNEMGWNNDRTKQSVVVDDDSFDLTGIAEKSGFRIFICKPTLSNKLPDAALRKKIEAKVTKLFQEHLIIFIDEHKQEQIWQLAVRKAGSPTKISETRYSISQDPELLHQRTSGLFFTLDEEEKVTIIDVTKRVADNFQQNNERVTKKFYESFKKEHTAFLKCIKGIDDQQKMDWYASLMLNRLMFCYFIQKKGFLDNKTNYLRDKLNASKEIKGKNKFYSFYRGFLLALFHEGLGAIDRSTKYEVEIGKIPYLNGGLFCEHEIETTYKHISIEDKAFEKLFDFFDQYEWHLDTRESASGRDINPDVVGYIFEKYINDRAQMGAYYTKEDITDYIAKNCIIPWLFDEVKRQYPKAFTDNGWLMQMIKTSGDDYIYEAVKYGVPEDGGLFDDLPEKIKKGFAPTLGKKLVDSKGQYLHELRKEWNKPAPADIALPTEIYREVIERRKRYEEIKAKIANGEIKEINDFITYNLNIRQFVQDVIETTSDAEFILHFYNALLHITILDPTCGSGAFLFAALNILELLYEACIQRMRNFMDEAEKGKYKFFEEMLVHVNAPEHPNLQYFIYKSIILNNLYGVDIMNEAVEIAKLRLFLKLVATVDADYSKPNLGLEPLPDIDFNIRAGNTLIGYATEEHLNEAFTGAQSSMLDFDNDKKKIEDHCDIVARVFTKYKKIQLHGHADIDNFKTAKDDLNDKLNELRNELNQLLHKQHYNNIKYKQWLATHQPFHWLAEFYEIVQGKGGFDVVIGNPPYVEYSTVRDTYKIVGYETESCGNLYVFVTERASVLTQNNSAVGFILPISLTYADKMIPIQSNLMSNFKNLWISSYAERPSKLFEGVEVKLSILCANNFSNSKLFFSTGYCKWNSIFRNYLFDLLCYFPFSTISMKGSFAKLSDYKIINIISKVNKNKKPIILHSINSDTSYKAFYFRAIRYWIKILDREPYHKVINGKKNISEMKILLFSKRETRDIIISFLSSTLFYLTYTVYASCQVFNQRDLNIQFDVESLYPDIKKSLIILSKELQNAYQVNSKIISAKKGNTIIEKQHFYINKSKPIIDQIDCLLAQHYGFTHEELDFIINYDIKYRMGKELDNGEDEE